LLWQTACHSGKAHEAEVNTSFLVTSPISMDTSFIKEYVCQIHSINHIEVRAMEKGYLQKIFVDEGQFVHRGQRLFQILPTLYEAEYQKAQAEINFAKIEYENTKQLADSNIVAPNELAMIMAKLDKAKAELALAQAHLQFTDIRAPFDGIIDRLHVRIGSLVDEGELLTSLSDNSQMWVYFNVPEVEYLDYKENVASDSTLRVNLIMANGKLFKHPGVVETIQADFNNETGNIAFRATFRNPEGLLRHGETGNIELRVPLENALIIPQKATFEILEKKYVFVIDKDNSVKTREITVSAEMEDLYAVTNGLDGSEKILLEGLRKVKENDLIKFEYQEPAVVMANLKVYAE
jgi:membrane fusion protein (multidrug efflux system)